ncbi:MAG: cytochrome c maturation protein CcmE [Alphaproteobacteria bacterium]|nr:cytochrome c maturation protein CcmE [Alphaproteobacteria bacterium]
MTRKRRRLYILGLFLLGLGTATALTLYGLKDNVAFFRSPTEVIKAAGLPKGDFRLGGLVEIGSIERPPADARSLEVRFRITDIESTVPVVYAGILPDLFREGQGVIANGRLLPDGTFRAREILAKHDENYMPPEVAEALKKSGRWNETMGKGK